jgi:hypothetical protein
MYHPIRLLAASTSLALAAAATQSATSHPNHTKHETVMQHATGSFEVKLAPLEPYNRDEGANIGRMSLDKQFHGELEATSRGEMLGTGNPKSDAGYVAIERVTGTLHGRQGSFALIHKGTMTRGLPALDIVVVPGSGSGDLAGLRGTMSIEIAPDGAHSYRLNYTFDAAQ